MDPLDQLHDIVELEQVSYWPLAWGWWLLLALLLAAIISISFRLIKRRRATAVLRQQQRAITHCASVAEVSQCLKLVVLHYFSGQQLETVTGLPWLLFLNQLLPTNKQYSEEQLQRIAGQMYQASNSTVFAQYHSFADTWLKNVPVLRAGKQFANGGKHV